MSQVVEAALVREGPARVFRRWIVFSVVGSTGFVVQLAVLTWLIIAGLHYLAATALAVEAAVLNNFIWHERWTWRDRTGKSRRGALSRLARFNLTVGAISVAENLFLMRLLVEYFALDYLAASVVSITICGLVNFVVSDWLVFRRPEPVYVNN